MFTGWRLPLAERKRVCVPFEINAGGLISLISSAGDDTHDRVDFNTSSTAPRCPSAVRLWSRFSRSEEHTSELQSQSNLVCRLLLEKKKPPISQAPRISHS